MTYVIYYPTLHTRSTKLEITHCLFDLGGFEEFRRRAGRTRRNGGKLNRLVKLPNLRHLAALVFARKCRELGGSRLYFFPLIVPVGCLVYLLECWDHKRDFSKMVRKIALQRVGFNNFVATLWAAVATLAKEGGDLLND